jgi:hypothetical protein
MLRVMASRHHIRLSTVLVALLVYLVENWSSILEIEICVCVAEASPLNRINLDTDPITIQKDKNIL